MEILCLRCGEPWHTDYVRHDAPEDFERKGCVITRCPCCPERVEAVTPSGRRRLATLAEVARMHGDDLEAFAAYLEDFGKCVQDQRDGGVMTTTRISYLKCCESRAVGPLVFGWFVTNPEDRPDSRFCWDSREEWHLAAFPDNTTWRRAPDIASQDWILAADDRGRLLIKHNVGEPKRAARIMQLVRGFGAEIECALSVVDYCRLARVRVPDHPGPAGAQR